MSPHQIVLLMGVVALVAIGLTKVAGASRRRFGLKEAEAAAQYIDRADAAQSVMAVVVGVLGYQNTVADDLESAEKDASALDDSDRSSIASTSAIIC